MADNLTDMSGILNAECEEDPPGLSEEEYHKRERRSMAVRAEIRARKEAARKAKLTPEELLDEVEPLELRGQDLNICRQWFNAVQDIHPAYLTSADYQLAREIYEQLGMSVPQRVVEGCEK